MIRMYVYHVGVGPGGRPFVVLTDEVEERFLPILIGPYEAHAIAAELEHQTFPRPLTHDLLSAVISSLEWQVAQVAVTKLEEDTFYAEVTLAHDSQTVAVDSRPSDAIALALRTDADIFVAEQVLEAHGHHLPEAATESEQIEKFKELLRSVKIAPAPDESDEERESNS